MTINGFYDKEHNLISFNGGKKALPPDTFLSYLEDQARLNNLVCHYNDITKVLVYSLKNESCLYEIDLTGMSQRDFDSLSLLIGQVNKKSASWTKSSRHVMLEGSPLKYKEEYIGDNLNNRKMTILDRDLEVAVKTSIFAFSTVYQLSYIIGWINGLKFTAYEMLLLPACMIVSNFLVRDNDVLKSLDEVGTIISSKLRKPKEMFTNAFHKVVNFVKGIFNKKEDNLARENKIDIVNMDFMSEYVNQISTELANINKEDREVFTNELLGKIEEYRKSLANIPNLSISSNVVDSLRNAFIRYLKDLMKRIVSVSSEDNKFEFNHETESSIVSNDINATLTSDGKVRRKEIMGDK